MTVFQSSTEFTHTQKIDISRLRKGEFMLRIEEINHPDKNGTVITLEKATLCDIPIIRFFEPARQIFDKSIFEKFAFDHLFKDL
jgi:hypothetical protein